MAPIRIKNDITELDFTKGFTHTSNQSFIHYIIFKYHIASSTNQDNLVKIGIPIASKIVTIKGVTVHLILNWLLKDTCAVYGLWAFPNETRYTNKFSQMFDVIYDIHHSRLHEKVN